MIRTLVFTILITGLGLIFQPLIDEGIRPSPIQTTAELTPTPEPIIIPELPTLPPAEPATSTPEPAFIPELPGLPPELPPFGPEPSLQSQQY
jgi:hypothetical protein